MGQYQRICELLLLVMLSTLFVNASNNNAHLLRRWTQSSDTLLQFQLIDATTAQVVVERLLSGMTVSLEALGLPESPSLNIVAVDETGTVAAVKFSNGRVEGGKPFSYCGDVGAGTSFNSCDDLQIGLHEITASAIAKGGALLGKSTIKFAITSQETNPGEMDEALLSFRLVYVPTKRAVADLNNGDVIALDELGIEYPSFTIEAVGSDQVSSVKFSNDRNEGAPPFYYCGDSYGGSKLTPCNDMMIGWHTVSANAFSQNGELLGTYSVSFEIANSVNAEDIPDNGGFMLEGSWIEIDDNAPLIARQETCFVFDSSSRRAYLIGGRDRGTSYPVDIYDPVTRQWSKGSEPPMELHHMDVS